jgi:hypothetical protein
MSLALVDESEGRKRQKALRDEVQQLGSDIEAKSAAIGELDTVLAELDQRFADTRKAELERQHQEFGEIQRKLLRQALSHYEKLAPIDRDLRELARVEDEFRRSSQLIGPGGQDPVPSVLWDGTLDGHPIDVLARLRSHLGEAA